MANYITSFIADGLLPGVWSVMTFLPMIAALFFFLSIFDDSNLLLHAFRRAGKFLSGFGLTPDSLYSMGMGFGCSVPALIAAGRLSSRKEQLLTTLTIPFISCSAKLPVYIMLASFLSPDFSVVFVTFIYILGIFLGLIACKSANAIIPFKTVAPSSAGLPPLQIPSISKAINSALSGCLSFIKKIFTIILAASAVIWFLENISLNLTFTENIEDSLLANLSKNLIPIFSPIGVDDWRAIAALLSGLTSKEAIVSTFSVISASSGYSSVNLMLSEIFTPLSAFSFMIFSLLYTPCLTSCIFIKKTIGKTSHTIYLLTFQFATAWGVSFLIFNLLKVIILLKEVFI